MKKIGVSSKWLDQLTHYPWLLATWENISASELLVFEYRLEELTKSKKKPQPPTTFMSIHSLLKDFVTDSHLEPYFTPTLTGGFPLL